MYVSQVVVIFVFFTISNAFILKDFSDDEYESVKTSFNFTGRVVLVTGSSSGIGEGIVKLFSVLGANVVVTGLKEDGVKNVSEECQRLSPYNLKPLSVVGDVTNSSFLNQLLDETIQTFGKLDVLVNNAGIGIFRAAGELTVEEWNRVIGTNLSGAFYCSREALERFHTARGGWIINISSLAGKNPFLGGSAYNASKFGLNGFSEATMLDHRYDNVRVSYIMPGSVETEFAGHDAKQKSDWKIAPEDIAEIVLAILRMPGRTLISRVEVRPSRPQKY